MTCPDEEGIETQGRSGMIALRVQGPMTCPDEEGIET